LEQVKALALAGPRPPVTRPLVARRQPGIAAADAGDRARRDEHGAGIEQRPGE